MLTYLRIYVISLITLNFIETGLYLTHPLQRFHRKNSHAYRKCLYVTSRSCRAFLFSDWSSLRNIESNAEKPATPYSLHCRSIVVYTFVFTASSLTSLLRSRYWQLILGNN